MTDETISVNPVDTRPVHERLSRREFEVFSRVAKGMGPKAIAGEFGVEVSTVGSIIKRVKDKTNLMTKQHWAVYAHQHGFGIK